MTIESLLIVMLVLCLVGFVGAMLRPDKVTPEPRDDDERMPPQ